MAGSPRPFSLPRLIPLGVLALGAAMFFALGGHHYVSFAALAEHREWLVELIGRSGATAVLVFIAGYAVLVAISFPGAALLTISSGFLFGPWLGTGYAVVGATIGATIVFLAARAGLAGLAARAGPWADRIATGFRANGLNYLLVIRLIPLFPFWVVNLAAGLVGLRLWVFVLGTFLGIIPVTFILANLGSGLGALLAEGQNPDLTVLFSPGIFLPLLGLAAFAMLPVAFRRWRITGGREPA